MGKFINAKIMDEKDITCKYQKDICFKDKTWIHRGGRVGYWLQPETIEELVAVGKLLYENNEPFVTIGHTSNTYFKNSFNVKYVIDTRQLTDFTILDENTLVCDCGAPMAKVSRFCVENGIAGYEGMIGLPGTVGGGVFCNSGCYGCGIEKILKYVELLTEQGDVIRLSCEQMDFAFRTSIMKRRELKGIILKAYFDISKREDKSVLQSIADKNKADRKETQDPPALNLGTTVNTGGYKGGFRNIFIKLFVRLYAHITKDRQKIYRFRKKLTCFVYNELTVEKYISDKRMDCFIWKDEGADAAYPLYLKMMEKVYVGCSLEIITTE